MRRNPPRFPDTPLPLPPNLSFVLKISPSVITLGLGRMRELANLLGEPQTAFRSVLVAGTNGKGSVTAYLSSILKSNGLCVGWYSSPHVYDVTERIRVDGEPVTIDEMEEAAARIVPLHERVEYSYFEALTAIAFLVFAERGVDIAVLETGLGGRFDATNVVEPDVCVLTQVGLDHRRILGDTKEEILREKLGITRPGTPFLVGPLSPELGTIVAERAEREGIPVISDLGTVDLEAMRFDGMHVRMRTPRRDYGSVRLPFLGEHQLANALLAVGAAEQVLADVGHLDDAANVYLPGRFEVRTIGDKRIVLDVGHNDDALIATARTLGALSPVERNGATLAMLRRKELVVFPRVMARWIRRIDLVQPARDEWYSAASLLERIGLANVRDKRTEVMLHDCFERDAEWERFIDGLLGSASPIETILITGSHQTVEQFGRRLSSRCP